MQLFAHRLEARPTSSTRPRLREANADEPGRNGTVGHLQRLHVIAPQVPGEREVRRYAGFGEMAVPLGPGAQRAVGQAQGVNDAAALPAVVAGWVRTYIGVTPAGT